MPSSKKTPGRATKPRVRRAPEEARALILGAATEVLAELGPDRAGLKDVARSAGVSHALVTHYFGTFEALVEEVLGVRMDQLREDVLAEIARSGERLRVADLVRVGLRAIREPVTIRLMAWAFLSRRMEDDGFFAYERQGLRRIVDALMVHPEMRGAKIAREEVERRIIIVWCATVTYAVTASSVWRTLGKKHTRQRDASIEAELVKLATAGL